MGKIPNTQNESHIGTESKFPDVRRTTFAPKVVFWAKSQAPNNEPQRYPEQNFRRFSASVSKPWGFLNNSVHFLKKNRACVQNIRFVRICQDGHSTYKKKKQFFCFCFSSGYLGTRFAWRWRPVRSDSGLREVVPEAVAACPWSIVYVDHAECAPLMS